MITFVMSEDHQYTLRTALENGAIERAVIILSYADFLGFARLPLGDYIFVDLERLSPAAIEAAAGRLAALRRAAERAGAAGPKVLNAPVPALERLAVMNALTAAGVNDFRVIPADRLPSDLRYPVFLRRLDDHDGPITDLLPDPPALEAALSGLGGNRGALAVTEYVDARDALGRHQKFSYFRIGDRFFPAARDLSASWVCKGLVEDAATIREPEAELAFLAGDAHEALMRPAFDAAGIGYGRADYVVIDGRAQVFEINTNPYLDPPDFLPPEFRGYAEQLMGRWSEALAAFSAPDAAAPRWIAVEGALPGQAAGRHGARRVFRAALARAGLLHRETGVMRALRAPKRLARRLRNRLRASAGRSVPAPGT